MRFFKRDEQRVITCPTCCQLIPAEALECDLCGADLSELPAERREAGLTAAELSHRPTPYAR